MDIEQRFGARLRDLRAQRRISQEKLSELSKLSVDTISNLERAISVPQLDSVEAIRAGCDMPIWELLDFLGRAEAPGHCKCGSGESDSDRRRRNPAIRRAGVTSIIRRYGLQVST